MRMIPKLELLTKKSEPLAVKGEITEHRLSTAGTCQVLFTEGKDPHTPLWKSPLCIGGTSQNFFGLDEGNYLSRGETLWNLSYE